MFRSRCSKISLYYHPSQLVKAKLTSNFSSFLICVYTTNKTASSSYTLMSLRPRRNSASSLISLIRANPLPSLRPRRTPPPFSCRQVCVELLLCYVPGAAPKRRNPCSSLISLIRVKLFPCASDRGAGVWISSLIILDTYLIVNQSS